MKLWAAFVCFIRDHDWEVLREDPLRRLAFLHASLLAGQEARCRRCGQMWDDFTPGV